MKQSCGSGESGNLYTLRSKLDSLLCHFIMGRGESVRKIQLPDLFPLDLEKEGVTPCFATVVVMSQGKMNQHGRVEYGAFIRNRNVYICPVGALAHYLFMRFHIINEPFPDMSTRKNWYVGDYSH